MIKKLNQNPRRNFVTLNIVVGVVIFLGSTIFLNCSVLAESYSKNFQTFLNKVNNYLISQYKDGDPEKIQPLILKGVLFDDAIRNNNKEIIEIINKDFNDSIVALIWFYYAIAIYKNQPFKSGTFTIVDPNFRIFDLLKENLKSYERISSHFKEYAKFINRPEFKIQYGLDLGKTLPKSKGTILFGKISDRKNLIFIKPEEFGTKKVGHIIRHGFGYAQSLLRKKIPWLADKAKDYFTKSLIEYLESYVETDDDPKFRKERIPLDLLKDYLDILNDLEETKIYKNPNDIKYLINEGTAFGIQKMHERTNEFETKIKSELLKLESEPKRSSIEERQKRLIGLLRKIVEFRANLETNYDNITFRFGREIIITPEDISRFVSTEDIELLKSQILKS